MMDPEVSTTPLPFFHFFGHKRSTYSNRAVNNSNKAVTVLVTVKFDY